MRMNVQGMTCAHCERAIQQAVAALGGTAHVDLSAGTVEVSDLQDEASVRHAIEDAGYTVVDTSTHPATPGCCCARR